MNKKKPVYIGIDVSKDTFNFHYGNIDGKYKNCRQGWQRLLKEAPPNSVYTMEATGVYHVKLASYLYSKGVEVAVFNPLRVRRLIEASGSKAKTDKENAKDITNYAYYIAEYVKREKVKVHPWKPLTPKQARARSIVTVLAALSRFEGASDNVNHAVKRMLGKNDSSLLDPMSNVSILCREQKKRLKNELCEIISEIYPEKFLLLKSIRGIGAYTAAVFLICAKGLEFDSGDCLSSFVGLVPDVEESGTSVKGKGKIVKTGNPYLRSLLYMCAFTAVKCNKACNGLYSRLIAKGKQKPVAHTAVMHRLVKIAFGVVKSGVPCRIGKPV